MIWELSPWVYSEKTQQNRPVYEVYEEVMHFIGLTRKKDGGKYAEKILGPEEVKYAPSRYWDIGLAIETGIVKDWKTMSPLTKAEIIARSYLKGMVSVVEAHRAEQRSLLEQRLKKNASS